MDYVTTVVSEPPWIRSLSVVGLLICGPACLPRRSRIHLVMIAVAILVVAARYIVFPGPQCFAGTYAGRLRAGA